MAIRLFDKDEVQVELDFDEQRNFESPDPSKEGPCVIALSGGVESVAVLEWAKKSGWFEPIICVHNVWKDIALTSSPVVNANIPKICEHYDVPLYIYEQSDPIQGFVDEKWGVKQTPGVHSSRHWLLTMMNIASRYPMIKHFFWGVNAGLVQPGVQGDYHFLARAYEFNVCFNTYAHSMSQDTGQRIVPPLCHMTKKQLWDFIPDDVKPLVQSCTQPLKFDGQSPCGQCAKCFEFMEINGQFEELEKAMEERGL